MRRPSALPVMIQVAALAAFAIVLSHAVAFAVLALSPEPRPAGFSIEAAALALKGEAAETADGRALKRRLSDEPVVPPGQDAVGRALFGAEAADQERMLAELSAVGAGDDPLGIAVPWEDKYAKKD